jgi:CheY-like chemotaxis protein
MIMVVDDEQDLREMVCLFIETEGHEVIDAENGKECIEKLKNGHVPDLILLDIMMPEMNGLETLKILKENASWKEIPVVFLTAHADSIAKNPDRLLVEDCIKKPFEIDDLKRRIDNVLKINKPTILASKGK